MTRFENSLMTYLACFQQNAKKTTQQCSLLHNQWITQNDVYHKINDVIKVPVYSRLKQDYLNFILQATFELLLKLASKIWCHFVENIQRSAHVPKRALQFTSEKTSVYRNELYIRVCNSRIIVSFSLCLVPF